jgi:kynurenine formamidase
MTIVDLTQPLGPATPVIGLPPMFASSPGVTNRRDLALRRQGAGGYWNTLRFGEHTGTHFVAPGSLGDGKDLPATRATPFRRPVSSDRRA